MVQVVEEKFSYLLSFDRIRCWVDPVQTLRYNDSIPRISSVNGGDSIGKHAGSENKTEKGYWERLRNIRKCVGYRNARCAC